MQIPGYNCALTWLQDEVMRETSVPLTTILLLVRFAQHGASNGRRTIIRSSGCGDAGVTLRSSASFLLNCPARGFAELTPFVPA